MSFEEFFSIITLLATLFSGERNRLSIYVPTTEGRGSLFRFFFGGGGGHIVFGVDPVGVCETVASFLCVIF